MLPAPLPHPDTSALPLGIALQSLRAYVFRCPSPVPVRTSFGIMHDRPALLVRAETSEGAIGWGEVWCNFPACGAEHRARLLDIVFAPLLLNQSFDSPQQAYAHATARTEVLALQTGEFGPLAQVIAGVDLALWDLCARRAALPLYRLLGGSKNTVPVYASGINPDAPLAVVQRMHAAGYRAFKLKIGFDDAQDLANLHAVREWLGPQLPLMADVNQAWGLDKAQAMVPRLAPVDLAWLEEPLRADSSMAAWQQLKSSASMPLAAGENMLGSLAFERGIASGALGVIQPDIAKWGGISGAWPVIQNIRAQGLRYCPHFLGAGIGLMASAHVLAAAGGDGMLEVDANDNALRSLLAPPLARVQDGRITLDTQPGMGVTPDLDALTSACT
jgi:L-alanine-DL-glutamate epimerase-like enolase superfamily enzyme